MSSERLGAFVIPRLAVSDKVGKLNETPGPEKSVVPATATSDGSVVSVTVHLPYKPRCHVRSTSVAKKN